MCGKTRSTCPKCGTTVITIPAPTGTGNDSKIVVPKPTGTAADG